MNPDYTPRRLTAGLIIRTLLFLAVCALLPDIRYASAQARTGRSETLRKAGVTAGVTAVFDRDYYPVARELVSQARKSVCLAVFELRYYPDHPDSPSHQLIKSLISAVKRGVNVEVCLEQSAKGLQENSQANYEAALILAASGVKVYLDNPEKTLHAKFLIVDRRNVLIGSTNWSYYSLQNNREANLLVDSPEIAGNFLKYFENLKQEARLLSTP